MLSFFPALGAFLSALFMYFYKLDDNTLKIIETELKQRRDAEALLAE
jgi:GPH family glycoside/pentoside/hexuronide:cation symporter